MLRVSAGYWHITTKAALPGPGITHIILHHLQQTLRTFSLWTSTLKPAVPSALSNSSWASSLPLRKFYPLSICLSLSTNALSTTSSKVHLPVPFQTLMTEEDSEILDFYPEEFSVDMNGKKMLWQGVALLPFIDEKRLLGAMAKKYPELTEDEHRRNAFGKDVTFVNEDHPLYDQISSLYMKRKIDNVGQRAPLHSSQKRLTLHCTFVC